MLITNNNIELRNLQEQVQKNKEDIAKHYEIDRTLANFGIKIVGTVATVKDLPDPTLYDGEYGDCYAVGQPGSYVYYIFTRPDPNAGITENHWLDVGKLGIHGPQGPRGPEGPQGPRGETGHSTQWFTNKITADDNAKPGDLLLEKNGDVFKYNGDLRQWVLVTNIEGPQGVQGPRGVQGPQGETGIQGPKGDTGEAGKIVTIAGILNTSSQLPLPSQINNLSLAYLVGVKEPYGLWIQIGDKVETAVWEYMGPFNAATAVMVNGYYQKIWNADAKLDKVHDAYRIYATGKNGEQRSYRFSSAGLPETIMFREWGSGTCNIADPINPLNITNKRWVEDTVKLYKHLITITVDFGHYHITALNHSATAIETLSDINTLINNNETINIFFNDTGSPQVILADASSTYRNDTLYISGWGITYTDYNSSSVSFNIINSSVHLIADIVID